MQSTAIKRKNTSNSSTQNCCIKAENKKCRQEHAFRQILELRKQNTGTTTLNRIILNVVATLKDPLVTKSSMNYMLKKQNMLATLNVTEPVTPEECDVATTSDAVTNIDHTPNSASVHMSSIETTDTNGNIDASHHTRSGGVTFVVNNAKVSTKELTKKKLQLCKTIAARKYYDEKQAVRTNGTSIAHHTLTNIIHDVEVEHALKAGTLKKTTIANRVYNDNVTGFNKKNTPPLYGLEPLIAAAIVEEARRGKSMKKDEIIQLGKDMSHGTIHARRFNDFMKVKQLESTRIEEEHANLGNAWYRGFCKRYSTVLKKAKVNNTDSKRSTYVTKDNFQAMYDSTYELMVKAGIADKLEYEVMLDMNGEIVDTKEEMYGLPTKYIMKHRRNAIFMDETGCNTNQKEDGLVGGEMRLVPKDNSGAGYIGSTTDIRWTLIGFTNGLGEAIMCAIIFKSEKEVKELPLPWICGIDRRIPFVGEPSNSEDLIYNMDHCGNMLGGPNCYIQGKQLPCFYGASPNSSVTGEMLREMLKCIDAAGIIDRRDGKRPVLVCDGHHSRYNIDFQQYLHEGPNRWEATVGVPYGTHVWQIADSPEMNGCFKIALTKAKREYRDTVVDNHKDFFVSDVVPLLQIAWEKSFALQEHGKKATVERGWSPLNYSILRYYPFIENTVDTTAILEPWISDEENQIMTVCFRGKAREILEGMASAISKNAGCISARQEKLTATNHNSKTFKALRDLPIRSGALFTNNQMVLSEALYDRIRELDNEKNEKAEKVASNKRKKDEKSKEKYTNALISYRANPGKMSKDDYVTLLRHFQVSGDSPLQSTKPELMNQFGRRNCGHQIETMFGIDMENGEVDKENLPTPCNLFQHTDI